jgi:hypothetical protein
MSDYTTERWHKLLVEAVAADPRGIQGVADRLGISRTQVSLVVSGKYEKPKSIVQRCMDVLDQHDCPYLGIAIPAEQCREVNAGPMPIWDPAAMEQRRTCQSCHRNPEGERK